MIKRIALFAGLALADETANDQPPAVSEADKVSADERFRLTDVSCDGVGNMSISYLFTPDNDMEHLIDFDCMPGVAKEALASPLVFNPYTCNGGDPIPEYASMDDFDVSKAFIIHAAVSFPNGKTWTLKEYEMNVSCEFDNTYEVTSEEYDTEELDQHVSFNTFTMSEADFDLSLNTPTENGGVYKANTQLVATFTAVGTNWEKLNSDIEFAPFECKVTQNGDDFFLISDNNACGFDQLLTELRSEDGGREWTLEYQTFVMNGDGQYTLACKVAMCTQDNLGLSTHRCAKANACN